METGEAVNFIALATYLVVAAQPINRGKGLPYQVSVPRAAVKSAACGIYEDLHYIGFVASMSAEQYERQIEIAITMAIDEEALRSSSTGGLFPGSDESEWQAVSEGLLALFAGNNEVAKAAAAQARQALRAITRPPEATFETGDRTDPSVDQEGPEWEEVTEDERSGLIIEEDERATDPSIGGAIEIREDRALRSYQPMRYDDR